MSPRPQVGSADEGFESIRLLVSRRILSKTKDRQILSACTSKIRKTWLMEQFGVSCCQRNRVFSDPQFCGYIPHQGAVWPLCRAKDVISPRGNLRHQDDSTFSVKVSLDQII